MLRVIFFGLKLLGGFDSDLSHSITTDASGNVYVTGSFKGTVQFDPAGGTTETQLTSVGSTDIFVLKLDATTGNFLWAIAIGGNSSDIGNSITTDASGTVYVTGYFRGTVDFDPGGENAILTSAGPGSIDIFVLKLNASGVFVWAKAIGSDATDIGRSITMDASGNVYITGHFRGTVDFNPEGTPANLISAGNEDIFVLKLNASGVFLWAKAMGGTGTDTGNSITIDTSGNLYITGGFLLTADFNPGGGAGVLNSVGSFDIFVLKLDAALGNFLWAKAMGGAGLDYAVSITTDPSNNIYLTGSFRLTADFDPGKEIIELTSTGNDDIFVLKLDDSGDFLWAKAIGGAEVDFGASIITDTSENVYITGNFQETVDFDPGTGIIELTSTPSGFDDIFVERLLYCSPLVADVGNLADLTGECSVAMPMAPTATNPCGTFTGAPDVTFPITAQGTTVITWTYDDGEGNTFTQTQNVIISDVTAPAADAMSLADLTGECSVAAPTAPTATDNCAGSITGIPDVSFPITGTTVVIWTYEDGEGNTSTQTQNVIITDVTPPVADAVSLADLTDGCSVAAPTAPTATDNCAGSITGIPDASFPITGTIVVTWTYDDGNGNTSSQTQNVIITDAIPPVADAGSLADLTEDGCLVVAPTAPTATDNCAGSITGTSDVTFPITAQGTTVVTWTYEDGNGNTSSQTQNVIITDVTTPVADDAGLADLTECSVATPTAPTATDNCAGSITGTSDVTFPITAQGTTVVTWTYEDGNGNISSQTQNVIITDVTTPVADSAGLADLTECSVATPTAPTATDNCAGSITGTSDVTFPITAQGTTVVTWTYEDGNGNISSQTQNVIITDVTTPVADDAGLADLTECSVATPTAPTATDNCAGSITGTSDVTFPITAQGTTVVTWTYDDGEGNTTTQTQNVIITPIDNTVSQTDITLTATAGSYTYQWVDCNNGNAPIPGESNQSFTPDTSGSYAVEISNGTCTVTSDCIDMIVLGITDELSDLGISVYPNPITDRLIIDKGENREIQIEILDNSGKLIISKTAKRKITSIDLSGYTAGVYFINLTNDEIRTVKRIIVK